MHLVNRALKYDPSMYGTLDVLLCTGNQIVKKNNELVMGAGNAKAMAEAIPEVPKLFARMQQQEPENRVHVVLIDGYFVNVGVVMTKTDWKQPSDLEFVIESLRALCVIAKSRRFHSFHLPYPAKGNGGIPREVLWPYVSLLPDNVLVYEV